MVSGGAGALVWMWISACFGLSSKFSECMLAIKYREVNEKGEMSGGPMYTMKKALKNKRLGAVLGWLFALFAVIASFGIGNMTQGNSISTAVHETFGVSVSTVGAVITILALLIISGGIKTISKVSSVVVPVMAIFYVIAGVIVILGNISNLPAGLSMIFHMAFSVESGWWGSLWKYRRIYDECSTLRSCQEDVFQMKLEWDLQRSQRQQQQQIIRFGRHISI